MLESLTQFWYMWLVLLVLIIITVFVSIKASKAVKRKNEIVGKQQEKLKRYSELVEKYKSLTLEKAETADAKELAEGVMCVLQRQIEKSENPDAEYNSADDWRREVYALFYFDEDVTAESLSFFFRNNGGPLPEEAVKGIAAIGYDKIQSVVGQMYAMCDDKNENVSFDKDRIAELDEKFRKIYNSEEFFEKVRLYILNVL